MPANFMGSPVNFGPDQDQLMEIQRRNALAQSLQAGAMAPLPQSRGPVHPFAGAAKLAKAYFGREQANKAQELAKALGQQQTERRGADMSLLAQALQGRPAQPGIQDEVAGTQTDPLPAQNPAQSLGQAIPMLSPDMQPMALNAMVGQQGRQDQREFQGQQLQQQQAFRSEESEKQRQFQQQMQEQAAAARAQGDRPYYQFLPSATGYMAGNARTGQVQPVQHKGQNVVPAAQDPNLQGQIAQQKASGKVSGETQTGAQFDLPRVINNAQNSIQLIDQLISHPGFESGVGMRVPGLGMIPGTDTASFDALLDQVKGGAFLEAFNSLKGGGQITEVEGKKATDAITRMSKSQSEAEFKKAALEYKNIIMLGVHRAQLKAGQGEQQQYSGPERRNSSLPQGVTVRRVQ